MQKMRGSWPSFRCSSTVWHTTVSVPPHSADEYRLTTCAIFNDFGMEGFIRFTLYHFRDAHANPEIVQASNRRYRLYGFNYAHRRSPLVYHISRLLNGVILRKRAMRSRAKFFLAALPDTDEERDVIHGTLHVQIRIGLSPTNNFRSIPCRIKEKRRRRGQLCKRRLAVHRCGKRARR